MQLKQAVKISRRVDQESGGTLELKTYLNDFEPKKLKSRLNKQHCWLPLEELTIYGVKPEQQSVYERSEKLPQIKKVVMSFDAGYI